MSIPNNILTIDEINTMITNHQTESSKQLEIVVASSANSFVRDKLLLDNLEVKINEIEDKLKKLAEQRNNITKYFNWKWSRETDLPPHSGQQRLLEEPPAKRRRTG